MGYEEFDSARRLLCAGDYLHAYIGEDDRFDFDEDHSESKYFVVQRDVVSGERLIPCWICARWMPQDETMAWHVGAGGNVVAQAANNGADLPCDIAIDITKPLSLPATWFEGDRPRIERKGTIDTTTALVCLARQAVIMQLVSLALRDGGPEGSG